MIGMMKFLGFVFMVIILLLLTFKRKSNKKKEYEDDEGKFPFEIRYPGLIFGIVLLATYLFLIPAIGMVDTGMRGVVLRFGAFTGKVLGEGIYVVAPILDKVEMMNIQVVRKEIQKASAASKDLQTVAANITLNYALDPEKVGDIYRFLRRDYEQRVIEPMVQEAIKAVTARFDAEKLITERPQVKEDIEVYLKEKLIQYGIVVRGVAITDFDFSGEFSRAIEQKVVATQKALEAERKLQQIKWEADQVREKARGDAEAKVKVAEADAKAKILQGEAEAKILAMQKANITKELVQLRNIEAQLKALEKWNGVLPTIVTGSGPVPIMDVFQSKK